MSTNIITTEGHEALKKELDHLWRVYRPEITQKVTWAASLGDRTSPADRALLDNYAGYFD